MLTWNRERKRKLKKYARRKTEVNATKMKTILESKRKEMRENIAHERIVCRRDKRGTEWLRPRR